MKHTDFNINTEEKIKNAARKIFMEKGFSATRTRDIAEEAGINLALLNYYFRSKQKLFDLVIQEKIQKFLGRLVPIFNDKTTSLEQKIDLIVNGYFELLSENPDLPLFVLNEIHKGNFLLFSESGLRETIIKSSFFQQLQEKQNNINPIQFLLSLLGMIIFPYIARPMLEHNTLILKDEFLLRMQERKKLIPIWMEAILNSK